jgi:hypothetical protein
MLKTTTVCQAIKRIEIDELYSGSAGISRSERGSILFHLELRELLP